MSVGMAIAEAAMAQRYGDDLVDHHTYVICGDGCLMEGVSHEAIDLAGHLKLSKLIVMWDDNRITIDGATSLATSTDQRARFEAAGWHTIARRRPRPRAIEAALKEAQAQDRPTLIACRTTIGFGAPNKQGTERPTARRSAPPRSRRRARTSDWPYPPFEIPAECLAVWREAGARSRATREAWEAQARRARRSATPSRARSPARFPPISPQRMAAYKAGLIEPKPERRDPQILGNGARRDQRRDPDHARRLGRPHPFEPHAHQGHGLADAGRFLRPLHPLRHPRIRHVRRR